MVKDSACQMVMLQTNINPPAFPYINKYFFYMIILLCSYKDLRMRSFVSLSPRSCSFKDSSLRASVNLYPAIYHFSLISKMYIKKQIKYII